MSTLSKSLFAIALLTTVTAAHADVKMVFPGEVVTFKHPTINGNIDIDPRRTFEGQMHQDIAADETRYHTVPAELLEIHEQRLDAAAKTYGALYLAMAACSQKGETYGTKIVCEKEAGKATYQALKDIFQWEALSDMVGGISILGAFAAGGKTRSYYYVEFRDLLDRDGERVLYGMGVKRVTCGRDACVINLL